MLKAPDMDSVIKPHWTNSHVAAFLLKQEGFKPSQLRELCRITVSNQKKDPPIEVIALSVYHSLKMTEGIYHKKIIEWKKQYWELWSQYNSAGLYYELIFWRVKPINVLQVKYIDYTVSPKRDYDELNDVQVYDKHPIYQEK